MKNQNKKIIALASVASLLMTAGIAFAQPQQQHQQQPPVVKDEPAKQAHQDHKNMNEPKLNRESPKHKRYVYVKRNGKTVKIDCWKKQNTKLKACKVK